MGFDPRRVALGHDGALVEHHESVGVSAIENVPDGDGAVAGAFEFDVVQVDGRDREFRDLTIPAPDVGARQQAPHVAKGPSVEGAFLHVGDGDLLSRFRRESAHEIERVEHLRISLWLDLHRSHITTFGRLEKDSADVPMFFGEGHRRGRLPPHLLRGVGLAHAMEPRALWETPGS